MKTDLTKVPFDQELKPGAHNAVYVCLKVQPSEKVTVITDRACEEIAASLVSELNDCGCQYNTFLLEDLAPRPLVDMPAVVLEDMTTSQVSIFAVQAQTNELRTRMQMCNVVNEKKLRHAHMVNIEKKIMLGGMRADFTKVDELTLRVMNIVNKAQTIRAITPAGTDIQALLTPEYKWIKPSGIISRDKWGNLPGGETFTAPLEVNGTFVIQWPDSGPGAPPVSARAPATAEATAVPTTSVSPAPQPQSPPTRQVPNSVMPADRDVHVQFPSPP